MHLELFFSAVELMTFCPIIKLNEFYEKEAFND